jgi:hypothetical protein
MTIAGRESLRAESMHDPHVETIALSYLVEADGDAHRAIRRVIADALADLLEYERRSRRTERLVSRGYVRATVRGGR